MTTTRRAVLASSVPAGIALAACGAAQTSTQTAQQPTAPAPTAGPPKEFTYVKPVNPAVDPHWQAMFDNAAKATGVKVTLQPEPGGAPFWEKRQNEFAAGTPSADAMYNQNNWVLIGGLRGMFVDHMPLMTRDKVDTKQYIPIELDSWKWKNKLYGIPFQSGGEGVLLNKQLFAEKGIPLPATSWTYDDLLAICQKLNDPANNLAALEVGQNGIQYMAGTFMRNFGGKVLNEQRNKAIYADDVKSAEGTQFNVDLHQKHKVTITPEMRPLIPAGSTALRSRVVAIQMNYVNFGPSVQSLGEGNVDVLPPPKGPGGVQTARAVGNAWSILSQSKNQDGAWTVLKWLHTRDGVLGSDAAGLKALTGWPPLIWAGSSPQWMDQFKGTRAADLQKVWATAGHNQVVLPEGDLALQQMNPPLARALSGEIGVREALRESQDKVNALFAQRPKEWEQ